jgi:hypothetical protein
MTSDGDKLRKVADWFDKIQDDPSSVHEWSDSREVQEDLREIARRLDKLELLHDHEEPNVANIGTEENPMWVEVSNEEPNLANIGTEENPIWVEVSE